MNEIDAVISRAARGELPAQRELLQFCLRSNDINGAEWWARIAASHGDAFDAHWLTTILMARCGFFTSYIGEAPDAVDHAINYGAEGMARLDRLADSGDDEAARQITMLSDRFEEDGIRPEIMALAATYRSTGEI